MAKGSATGLQQLQRMQGIEWGDGAGNDYHLWIDGDTVYTDAKHLLFTQGDIQAVGTLTVQSTAGGLALTGTTALSLQSSGTISLTGNGTSSWITVGATLLIETLTSGTLTIASAGELDLTSGGGAIVHITAAGSLYLDSAGAVFQSGTAIGAAQNSMGIVFSTTHIGLFAGTGSPSGVLTAPNGSLYLRYDGGANAHLYVNTSGASTSGSTWTAVTD